VTVHNFLKEKSLIIPAIAWRIQDLSSMLPEVVVAREK